MIQCYCWQAGHQKVTRLVSVFSDLINDLHIQHSFPVLRKTQCLVFQELFSFSNKGLVLPDFSYPYLSNIGILSKRIFSSVGLSCDICLKGEILQINKISDLYLLPIPEIIF
jgi:hypothetical protein